MSPTGTTRRPISRVNIANGGYTGLGIRTAPPGSAKRLSTARIPLITSAHRSMSAGSGSQPQRSLANSLRASL